jgi:hypothetical protein
MISTVTFFGVVLKFMMSQNIVWFTGTLFGMGGVAMIFVPACAADAPQSASAAPTKSVFPSFICRLLF